MAEGTVRGWFVWHDLLTPNLAGAHEFYEKTLGWKKQTADGDPSYVMLAARSGPVGGTVESRSATPHWLPYISTADVDATIEAASRLDARVTTPATALPNGGRYAVLVDPQGAPFGIHASSKPEAGPGEPGEFSWHELATDIAPNIAFAFYAALFDWDEISQHDMGAMGTYLIFGRDGRQLGGIFDKGAAGKSGPAYWLSYVRITDLEGVVEKAKTARGSLLAGPMEVPGGDRIAQLMDPYGAFFALHKAASQAAAGKAPARESAQPAAAKKPASRTRAAKKKPAKKAAAKKAAGKKAAAKRAKAPARKQAKSKPVSRSKAARKPAKAGRKAQPRAKPKAKAKPKPKAKAKAKAKKRKKRGR